MVWLGVRRSAHVLQPASCCSFYGSGVFIWFQSGHPTCNASDANRQFLLHGDQASGRAWRPAAKAIRRLRCLR
eukprot:COSAG01_NODE_50_length_31487_cov_90.470243_20_plen_73_part_00